MNDANLRRKIAQLSVDSSKVFITDHAKRQMERRRVNRRQVDDVLTKGHVVESAHRNTHGNWQCTLEYSTSGDLVKVAAALEIDSSGESVIVITVMN